MEQPNNDLLPIASLCGIYIWEYQGLTISYDPEYQAIDVNDEPVSYEEAIDLLQTINLMIPSDGSYTPVLELIKD